jgi:hypothetical protein
MKNTFKNILVVFVLTLATFACGITAPAGTPQPVLPVMVEPVELKSSPLSEESQAPVYKITAQNPYLDPSTDPSVQAFNTAVKSIVDGEIAAFKGSMAEMPAMPISAGSSFDIQYQLIGQKGSIWSIQFNVNGYADGAAHPYHYAIPFNYDLQNAKQLTLDDIFLPNSNYLQTLSDYSKTELTSRNIGFEDGFQQGAEPTAENYKNWNISNEGFLVITFNEYQVAAYAAGPQVVTIPLSSLGQIINSQGPLAPFLQ